MPRASLLLDLLLGLLLAAVAVLLRALPLPEVTAQGATWIFYDDTPYHLRRALMTLESWPHVPGFDPFFVWIILLGTVRAALAERCHRRIAWICCAAIGVGLAMLLWPGILLHLGAMALTVLLASAWLSWRDRPGRMPAHSSGRQLALAGAMVFAASLLTSLPAVTLSPWGRQPVYFAPSPLHLACLAAASLSCAVLSLTWGGDPSRRIFLRLLAALALPALLLLAVPPLRQGLIDGLRYVFSHDFAALAAEAQGMASNPREMLALMSWPAIMGTLLALPLLCWRRPEADQAEPLLVLLLVAAVLFAILACLALRFMNAWSPLGAASILCFWRLALAPLGARLLPG